MKHTNSRLNRVIKMLSFKKILTTCCLGVVAAQLNAQPVVNGFVGDLKPGTVIEVYGTGFGEMDGEIVSWDDFEKHTDGELINGSDAVIGGGWSTIYGYNGSGARFENSKSHSGSIAAHLDWSIDSNTIRAFGWAGKGSYNKLYITYQRYMEGDYKTDSGYNHKQFYLYGNQSQFPQGMPLIPAGSTSWGFYNNVGDTKVPYSQRNNMNTAGWKYSSTIGAFQRWEWFIQLNQPYTNSNGIIQGWVEGVQGIDNKAYRHRYVDGEYVDFRLGHMAQGFTSTAKAWFDDLYIATTKARVELCDKPTWTECRSKEIQIVEESTWNNSGVSFTLNSGFSNFAGSVYLYVVDKDGVANESGFALTEFNPIAAPLLSVE